MLPSITEIPCSIYCLPSTSTPRRVLEGCQQRIVPHHIGDIPDPLTIPENPFWSFKESEVSSPILDILSIQSQFVVNHAATRLARKSETSLMWGNWLQVNSHLKPNRTSYMGRKGASSSLPSGRLQRPTWVDISVWATSTNPNSPTFRATWQEVM